MRKFLLVISFLFLINTGCKKSILCDGEDKNKGIIVSAPSILCFPDSAQDNYIIRDESTYRLMFNSSPTSLPTCSLPTIDFNNFDLLGLPAEGSGCDIKYIRNVKRVENKQKYEYSVKVRTCGLCKMLGTSDNWILVPKIPEGWSISFEVE